MSSNIALGSHDLVVFADNGTRVKETIATNNCPAPATTRQLAVPPGRVVTKPVRGVRLGLVCIAILASLSIGLSLATAQPEGTRPPAKPAFEMAPQQRKAFAAAANSLRLGTPRREVVQRLGRPDEDALTAPKSDPRDAAVTGRALTYYVTRWSANEVNAKQDQMILLQFDRDTDRLRSLLSTVPEIFQRGLPR